MKKLSAVLIVFILMAFTRDRVEQNEIENKESTLKIQTSISEFQEIIIQKHFEIQSLETISKELATSNSEEAIRAKEQVNLLKMNCLKYEAAIACLQRHIE